MKKIVSSAALAVIAIATPSTAFAQSSDTDVEPFIGASVGYHDIGTVIPDDDGIIYGVVAGVDVPVTDVVFVGAEANFHLGDNAIDSEYGVAARLGLRVGDNSKLYVRGGYQEVDFDLGNFGVATPPGFDTTEGDYLVGAGAEIGLGGPLKLRANVDTIAFDSVRVTGGVLFSF